MKYWPFGWDVKDIYMYIYHCKYIINRTHVTIKKNRLLIEKHRVLRFGALHKKLSKTMYKNIISFEDLDGVPPPRR